MERTLGKVSQYSIVRECHAIPCVLPIVTTSDKGAV